MLTSTSDMEMEVFMGGSPFMGMAVGVDIKSKGCADRHPTNHQQGESDQKLRPTRKSLDVPQIFEQDRQQRQQDNAQGMPQTPCQTTL